MYDAHTSRKPEVEAAIRRDYAQNVERVEAFWSYEFTRVPNLRFQLTETEQHNAGVGMLTMGMHRVGSDEIYITSGVIPSPDDNLLEKVELWFTEGFEPSATVQHELTHTLAEQIGHEQGCYIGEERKEQRVVQEGIATYAEVGLGSRERDIDCSTPRPTKVEKYHNYNDGFCFVKPILDQDRNEGLVYLVCNPPREEDLLQPEGYYTRFRERK